MHVIFINPEGDYVKLVFCAVVFGFIQVYIGVVIMSIFIYSVKTNYEDMHAFWCTVGVSIYLIYNH